MRKTRKAQIAAGGIAFIATAWKVLQTVIDAASLPEDTSKVWSAIVSAPDYIPWAILALCVAVLGWSVWPAWRERRQESLAGVASDLVPSGTPRPARSEMEFDDFFAERTAKWVDLLWLRDEAEQTKGDGHWLTTPGQNEAFALLLKLQQAAVDGEIAFRGRRFDYDRSEMMAETVPLTSISANHFEDHAFFWQEFLEAENNYRTFVGTGQFLPNQATKTFRDIRADREQLAIWYSRYRKEQTNG